ncbi:PTS sugar transporter subunit IIA [Falsibacillus pallidus]|uniref:PTS sugar transporter subunit IIA n=1 Tax=Falsibacillus pallidus TaxID=493781 RepID=UPI003D965325
MTAQLNLLSPFTGKPFPLEDVKKTKFANGMMGKGIAVIPEEGKLVAPCSGEVMQVFPTKHALSLHTESGVEILVQIGQDTEKLEGKGFEVHVEEKDKVKEGDLLISFDLDALHQKSVPIESPVVIINANRIDTMNRTTETSVTAGSSVLLELGVKEDDDSDS